MKTRDTPVVIVSGAPREPAACRTEYDRLTSESAQSTTELRTFA